MRHYLGYLDANNRHEREDLLLDNFVLTESIRQALKDEYPFVCGRKGSGKSAVGHHLERRADFEGRTWIHTEHYEQLHAELLSTIRATESMMLCTDEDLCSWFYRLWSYILHLAVLRTCTDLEPRDRSEREHRARVREYLASLGAGPVHPAKLAIRRAGALLRRCARSETAILEFSQGLDAFLESDGFPEARASAAALLRDRRALVIIDTLEQYNLSSRRIFAFRGMVRAVKEVFEQGEYRRLTLKCFLPIEMTEAVFTENSAKYKDLATVLEWSYAELLELIARRYATFLARRSPAPVQALGRSIHRAIEKLRREGNAGNHAWRREVWQLFGPRRVTNGMGWSEDGLAYLLRHTQKRPREVLGCGNHVVEAGIRTPAFPQLDEAALRTGLHAPENLDTLLSDSLAVFSLPHHAESATDLIRRMLSNEPRIFPGKDLRRILKRAFSRGPLESTSGSVSLGEIEGVLLRSGLLGVVEMPAQEWRDDAGHAHRYYRTRFEYCIPGLVQANERSVLAMHPMLADALEARFGSFDPGVVYHLPEPQDLVLELNQSRA